MLNSALFVDYADGDRQDIDFYSLCEHHLLPFFGKCMSRISGDKVIGLSKIPRPSTYSAPPAGQERLTSQIAETIKEKIAPLGVAVVVEATHLCIDARRRGQNSFAVTSSMLGTFRPTRERAWNSRADQAAEPCDAFERRANLVRRR